ncbi:MAG: rhodanese-like domain-containing protein [Phormidesmis sp.]
MATKTSGDVFDAAKEKADKDDETAKSAERAVLDKVDDLQDAIGKVTPVPTDFNAVSSPSDVKKRLDWGEPDLTIVDVRSREAFNEERIMGAIPGFDEETMELLQSSTSKDRDIYLYGNTDQDSEEAASQLRSSGYQRISVIKGGLSAWKAIDGTIEGQKSI